jgi:3-hydroxyacyl-CoA dehydrogenase
MRGDVVLCARSQASAERAHRQLAKLRAKLDLTGHVSITTDLDSIADRTFVIEAVAEELAVKHDVLRRLGTRADEGAVIGTTTSSLCIQTLAQSSGRPDRFVAFHVFNPVPRMQLVELAFPQPASKETRARARALATSLDKRPVEVPGSAGFVVNRLLFPYLFDAVRFAEESGVAPAEVDACMTLGAGYPMGPCALLDLVGLDVSMAIGESLGIDIPPMIRRLVSDGALGRKAGRGLHDYEARDIVAGERS